MLVPHRIPPEAIAALRRFGWMFLSLYAISSIALWAISVAAVGFMGPVTAYTIEISVTLALTFGALYAAASALRTPRRAEASAGR